MASEIKLAVSILIEYLVVFFTWEDGKSQHEKMHDDPSWEHIANWLAFSLHIFDVDDLRGYESGRSTPHKQIFFLICFCCQPEITNADL